MRLVILSVVLFISSGSAAVADMSEGKWLSMPLQERSAHATAYTKRSCPHMPPMSAEDYARRNEIGNSWVMWAMVKSFIDGKCPPK